MITVASFYVKKDWIMPNSKEKIPKNTAQPKKSYKERERTVNGPPPTRDSHQGATVRSRFEVTTDAEWDAFLQEIEMPASTPILSENALSREAIYTE
jgi:hypothetical protein